METAQVGRVGVGGVAERDRGGGGSLSPPLLLHLLNCLDSQRTLNQVFYLLPIRLHMICHIVCAFMCVGERK